MVLDLVVRSAWPTSRGWGWTTNIYGVYISLLVMIHMAVRKQAIWEQR